MSSPRSTASGARSRMPERRTWASADSTFVIDADGNVAKVFRKVKPDDARRPGARGARRDLAEALCPASGPRYTTPPRGCGGTGRRARFRSVWAKARGGSSPLIRIASSRSTAPVQLIVFEARSNHPSRRTRGALAGGRSQRTATAGDPSRIEVVVTRIRTPPLAQAPVRPLGGANHQLGGATRYLETLTEQQDALVAQIHAAAPEHRVRWRYRLVLDAVAVVVPLQRAPASLPASRAWRPSSPRRAMRPRSTSASR